VAKEATPKEEPKKEEALVVEEEAPIVKEEATPETKEEEPKAAE